MDVADPRGLRDVLRRHGVRAATSLGQRFLVDRAVLSAIVDAAELSADDDVLEVGPGPGVLTAELARRARSVVAVEVDERMVRILSDTLAGRDNVHVVRADALAVDLYALGDRRPTRIVANLPYQITTPLLERFLADERRPPLIVVLVQEEVAKRMAARETNERAPRERGYLSVFVESFADARVVRRVPARAFRPPPRVSSAIVALRTRWWERGPTDITICAACSRGSISRTRCASRRTAASRYATPPCSTERTSPRGRCVRWRPRPRATRMRSCASASGSRSPRVWAA